MYDQYKHLKFERSGRLLLVTMDNPPVNAAHFALHDELSHVFYDIERDSECDVAVLTGAGRTFSAGGDLPGMLAACNDSSIHAEMMRRAPHIVRSILAMSKPLIARVNGHAMGLGATLALLADVAIAAEGAKIADPHVNIGLSPGDGGALLWPLLIGYARARHYLLTGDVIMAGEAATMGLIHQAVPADQLDETVQRYADRLLALPRLALRATKSTLNLALRQQAEGLIDAHAGMEQQAMASRDHREAVLAMIDKRQPVFQGN